MTNWLCFMAGIVLTLVCGWFSLVFIEWDRNKRGE